MKLIEGENVPEFSFTTKEDKTIQFSDVYKQNKHTLLLFLRYYGCTVCQLDMLLFKEKYSQLKKSDAEIIIVLQSTPNSVKEQGTPMPYYIACDPDKELFEMFEVWPAKSMKELASEKVYEKAAQAKKLGLKHGEYEGEETQLPAAFLIDGMGKIEYSRYAKNITDIPTPEDVLNMVTAE